MPGGRPSPRRGKVSRPVSRPRSGPGRRTSRTRTSTGPQAAPRPRFTGRAAILVLVVAVLMVSYASSLRAFLEQRQHLQTLRADIAESKGNIAALEREQKRWKDPAFLRAEAHERLGWVLPGEIAFQVIGADGKPLDRDDSLSDPRPPADEAAPLWWQSAWSSVVRAGLPDQQRDLPEPATRIKPPKSTQR